MWIKIKAGSLTAKSLAKIDCGSDNPFATPVTATTRHAMHLLQQHIAYSNTELCSSWCWHGTQLHVHLHEE